MKQTLVFLAFSLLIKLSSAQVPGNAIGLRAGWGFEFSYQHGIPEKNRIEADLGFFHINYNNVFKVAGIFQWVMPISDGFYWYAGPGFSIGKFYFTDDYFSYDHVFINILGQIGIEYRFHAPFLISLDFRPEFPLLNAYDDFDIGPAIGVRYILPSGEKQ